MGGGQRGDDATRSSNVRGNNDARGAQLGLAAAADDAAAVEATDAAPTRIQSDATDDGRLASIGDSLSRLAGRVRERLSEALSLTSVGSGESEALEFEPSDTPPTRIQADDDLAAEFLGGDGPAERAAAMLERGESVEDIVDGLETALERDDAAAGPWKDENRLVRRVGRVLDRVDGIDLDGRDHDWELTTSDDGPEFTARGGLSAELTDEFFEGREETVRETVEDAHVEQRTKMYGEDSAPMHQVAAEMTGNTTVPDTVEGDAEVDATDPFDHDVSDERLAAYRAYSDRVTEFIRENAGDTITLYRGYNGGEPTPFSPGESSDLGSRLRAAAEDGESFTVEHRCTESWTTDPLTAADYAEGGGAVVRREVPAERVVAAGTVSDTLLGEEFVVAHDEEHEYDPDQIQSADPRTVTREVLRQSRRKLDDDP